MMSRAITLCEDSDDNGEWANTNTASVPSLPLSRKRPRDKEESPNDADPRNANGPGNKTAIGSAKFVIDPELADEAEVSLSSNKKRRGGSKSNRSRDNYAPGNYAQFLKGVHATEKDVEGIAAAISHPLNSDSEQTSRDDGSADKHPQKLSASKPPSNASRRQSRVSAWEGRLSELADYRKIHGHCNVPQNYSENIKLGRWVGTQRKQFRLQLDGKTLAMTPFRIQELESLSFEWDSQGAVWKDRFSKLADYRKIQGHWNIPRSYSENTKLAIWVGTQRRQYRLHQEGQKSFLTLSRIQESESLGFEWEECVSWDDPLSEIAEDRKIHGHCNVSERYSENSKLANWVACQRSQYIIIISIYLF